jgi:signal recognition particle subunit SRP54
MKNMAGQFGLAGLPGMGGGRKAARGARKGGKARGPKTMPAIAGIAAESSGQRSVGSYETPGLNQLPPGLAGLDQVPEGFDPGALTFPGNAGGGGGRGSGGSGGGKKGNKKRRK